MRIIVDTSVIIDFLRRKDKENSLFIKCVKEEAIISIITAGELYSGKKEQNTKEFKSTTELINGVKIIYPSLEIAQRAGALRAKYEIPLADAFIAAEAITLNIPLATLDKKDFSKIENLRLYVQKIRKKAKKSIKKIKIGGHNLGGIKTKLSRSEIYKGL